MIFEVQHPSASVLLVSDFQVRAEISEALYNEQKRFYLSNF